MLEHSSIPLNYFNPLIECEPHTQFSMTLLGIIHRSFVVAKNLKTNPNKYAEGKQTRWNNYIPSNRFEFKRDCLQPKFGKIGHSQYIEWFLIARTMYHGLWKFWNRRFFSSLWMTSVHRNKCLCSNVQCSMMISTTKTCNFL